MTLLELIDAFGEARERAGAAWEVPGSSVEATEANIAAIGMREEIGRRLKLAKADHPIMWDCHLGDNERSHGRQRELIAQHAKDVAAGRRPYLIIEHCRKDLG